jgi:hypothetical protein
VIQDLPYRLALHDRCDDFQITPPQCGHWAKCRLNTRFNSLAQPKRIGRPCSGGPWLLSPQHIVGFSKAIAKAVAILLALISVYLVFLFRDVKKVDAFCSDMVPGLDTNQAHVIAEKYGVGSKNVRDPNAVANQTLGVKVGDKENTWFFGVGAPMTVGEHSCGVDHDYHVVLSAKLGG